MYCGMIVENKLGKSAMIFGNNDMFCCVFLTFFNMPLITPEIKLTLLP
jgi:hypothetical protein